MKLKVSKICALPRKIVKVPINIKFGKSRINMVIFRVTTKRKDKKYTTSKLKGGKRNNYKTI